MRDSLNVSPIGYVRTSSRSKFEAPSQPDPTEDVVNVVELIEGQAFDLALQDLCSFDKIWLIWWFDRNKDWRPRVMPPRGPAKRRGVFSTRSPHRPNPLGLTCVSLLRVEGLRLEVGPLDLVDGTPILDIKPYLRTVDCYPDASLGWLEPIVAEESVPPTFRVELTPEAASDLAWLRDHWGIDFTERAFAILRRDPLPHRTRRILKIEDFYRISCGAWRMYYRIQSDVVSVFEIAKGHSDENLVAVGYEKLIDREAQIAFAEWKDARARGAEDR